MGKNKLQTAPIMLSWDFSFKHTADDTSTLEKVYDRTGKKLSSSPKNARMVAFLARFMKVFICLKMAQICQKKGMKMAIKIKKTVIKNRLKLCLF